MIKLWSWTLSWQFSDVIFAKFGCQNCSLHFSLKHFLTASYNHSWPEQCMWFWKLESVGNYINITNRIPILRTEHSLYTSEYWVGISDSIILCSLLRQNKYFPSLSYHYTAMPTIVLSYVKRLWCSYYRQYNDEWIKIKISNVQITNLKFYKAKHPRTT